jgi:two-component system heavy metal sensor histidine kinase CusS
MRTALSLTARVSLLFAAASAGVLLVAGALFEHAAESHFLRDDREELDGKMALIRSLLAQASTPRSTVELPAHIDDMMSGHPGIAIVIAAADGATVYSAGPEVVVSHLLEGGTPLDGQLITWSHGDRTYRIEASRAALGAPKRSPLAVAIALDISDDRTFMAEFHEFLWSGMAFCVALMAVLGWAAAHRGLRPLRTLSGQVAAVSAEHLGEPLPAAGVPQELHVLVEAFNRMLARLEDSFRRLSEFSTDLAHELRAPIQNLLIQTQVTLGRERDAAEYRATLQSNIEELERLSRIASEMLFLARADNRLLALKREPVELHEEVERLFGFYEAYAGEREVGLTQSGTATLSGDRLMLQRAISNLLSNAIRFTPAGRQVSVEIAKHPGVVELSVTNPGARIPPEQLERVFERLYRADAGRREGDSGHAGLGLAIAKSIVEMHAGTIGAESASDATRFTITLPAGPVMRGAAG